MLDVSMQDVANAISTLNAETSEFASLNESTQLQLATVTVEMEKLKVSSADTAMFLENAFKIMNMGATEAIQVQKELAMAGASVGIGADKIIKQYNSASKVLAVYGRESIGVFKDLAAQAKAANVEVSTLLGMVQKYDTFAGAAEGASQFNALLGTQLSTTEMLMMTEDERTRTLIESVQAQGIAFGDMDKYTQKAIAAAAGINDMNEANRIFGMSLKEYDKNKRVMDQNADAQKKFEEAINATVPAFKQFQLLATEMIAMVQPALEVFGDMAQDLAEFFRGLDSDTKELVGTTILFLGGLAAIAPVVMALTGAFKTYAAIQTVVNTQTGILAATQGTQAAANALVGGTAPIAAAATGTVGTAAGAATAPVLGFAKAMLLVAGAGIGIGAAFAGIGYMIGKIGEASKSGSEKLSEAQADAIKSLDNVLSADFEKAYDMIKKIVEEVSKLGADVKVSSTIENLALVTAGTAVDLTGKRVEASVTNITANVQNVFSGVKIILEAGGKQLDAYIAEVVSE